MTPKEQQDELERLVRRVDKIRARPKLSADEKTAQIRLIEKEIHELRMGRDETEEQRDLRRTVEALVEEVDAVNAGSDDAATKATRIKAIEARIHEVRPEKATHVGTGKIPLVRGG